jgi:hypothetical protein
LAHAVRCRASAEEELREVDARLANHDATTARWSAAETASLMRGELRAVDLARADAWHARVAAERAAIEVQRDRARVAREAAFNDECETRKAAISSRNEKQLVEDDRTRWHERLRSSSEAVEDEAMTEAWRYPR